MRFLIMGAGALGSYFGGRLQAAGHDVTYVARGAHLEALQTKGLVIESGAGDLTLPEVRAVAHPSEAPEADAVFFLVKNYDVESAAEALLPTLGSDTFLVTGQNGVSAPRRLAEIVGRERVVPGVVMMPADLKAPGVVRHPVPNHQFAIGELSGEVTERVSRFAEAFRETGVTVDISTHIEANLWQKFVVMATLSSMTALTRLDLGPLRDTPETRALLEAAIEEAALVARADCADVPNEIAETVKEIVFDRLPNHLHASMLDDLNRGKRIELNYLGGDLVRLGRMYGVATPTHDLLVAALMPYLDGMPGG